MNLQGLGLVAPQPKLPPQDNDLQELLKKLGSVAGKTAGGMAGQPTAAQGGVPQFKSNPFGAIGYALQSAAAGMEGRQMPQPQGDRTELQKAELLFRIAGQGIAVAAGKLPPEKVEPALNVLGSIAQKVAPEFDFMGLMRASYGQPDLAQSVMALMRLDGPKKLQMLEKIEEAGGTPEAVLQVMRDKEFVGSLAGQQGQQADAAADSPYAEVTSPASMDRLDSALNPPQQAGMFDEAAAQEAPEEQQELPNMLDDSSLRNFEEINERMKQFTPVVQQKWRTGQGRRIASYDSQTQRHLSRSLNEMALQMDTLDLLRQQYDPRYLRLGYRTKQAGTGLQEIVSDVPFLQDIGPDLTPERRRELYEYRHAQTVAVNTMNKYIHAMTGAQLSNAEAERLSKGMAKFGEGLLPGDSETGYAAALDATILGMKMAMARLHYSYRFGVPVEFPSQDQPGVVTVGGQELDINEMPTFIAGETARHLEQLHQQNPQMTEQDLTRAAAEFQAHAFGLK